MPVMAKGLLFSPSMAHFLTILWDFPKSIDLGFFELRLYSLLFATGFFLGYRVMLNIFKRENLPQAWLDQLLTYMVVATIVGARLGHVFFYQWDYYRNNPLEILMIWEGGLASHGAAIAIIVAMVLYSKRVSKKPVLWILDRVVITVALAGCFIRLGNLTNSEIYGKPANSAMETVFVEPAADFLLNNYGEYMERVEFASTPNTVVTDSLELPVIEMAVTFYPEVGTTERARDLLAAATSFWSRFKPADQNLVLPQNPEFIVDQSTTAVVIKTHVLGIPRYPTQIIEALAYLLIFIMLWDIYLHRGGNRRNGLLFGTFLVLVFGFRFAVEYLKEVQVSFESGMSLNMGQWLSIPLVAAGLFFIVKSLNEPHER